MQRTLLAVLACMLGGVVVIIFGLHMTGLIHIPYLERTYQLPTPAR